MQNKSNQQRISSLKGLMKFSVLAFAVIALFLSLYLSKGEREQAPLADLVMLKIEQEKFAADKNYIQVTVVKNRPLLILKYLPEDRQCIEPKESNKEWFVAWAQGRDFGCPLKLSMHTNKESGDICRALQDECRGSLYKLDGEVYENQFSTQNLRIPKYEIKLKDDGLWLAVDAAS